MIKPNIPNMSSIPGIGAMTDTLDFVKNLWGKMGLPGMNMPGMNIPGMPGMNVPGMVMPTLSVDEINKKISDLKAVESWLGLNMSMLRSTIQALEVQAATITTLQTMGERFTSTMTSAAQSLEPQEDAPSAAAKADDGAAARGNGNGNGRAHHPTPEPTSRDEEDAASLTAPLVNAAAWWNMLQDQFKQAVSGAMTDTQPTAPAEKPKARTAAKPKASATSSASSSASKTPRKRKTTGK